MVCLPEKVGPVGDDRPEMGGGVKSIRAFRPCPRGGRFGLDLGRGVRSGRRGRGRASHWSGRRGSSAGGVNVSAKFGFRSPRRWAYMARRALKAARVRSVGTRFDLLAVVGARGVRGLPGPPPRAGESGKAPCVTAKRLRDVFRVTGSGDPVPVAGVQAETVRRGFQRAGVRGTDVPLALRTNTYSPYPPARPGPAADRTKSAGAFRSTGAVGRLRARRRLGRPRQRRGVLGGGASGVGRGHVRAALRAGGGAGGNRGDPGPACTSWARHDAVR